MNTDPAPKFDESLIAHKYAEVGGMRLHYVEAGSGPLVALLHGFPEFWYSWRHQIPALAGAGFRVVAPDMRGYNLSDKPRGVHAYGVRTLVEDWRVLSAHAAPTTHRSSVTTGAPASRGLSRCSIPSSSGGSPF